MFAQSVGGGGGAAGGGTATASGGNLAIAVAVGGKGGAGGNGNTATVQNSGSVVTRGTDAVAISVQSVGGGGGTGGKGGATAGGVSTLSNAQNLLEILGDGLHFNQQVTDLGDGILQIGQIGENIEATIDELKGILSQPQADEDEIGTSKQIDVSVSVGGSGGAAGDGGAANATNTGSIVTFGAQSDGIYAQKRRRRRRRRRRGDLDERGKRRHAGPDRTRRRGPGRRGAPAVSSPSSTGPGARS